MDLGGVRQKMTRKNCERINNVKTVKVYNCYGGKTVNCYGFKTLVRRRTTIFFKWKGNIILMPTVNIIRDTKWVILPDVYCHFV